jgi:hypothetical protein
MSSVLRGWGLAPFLFTFMRLEFLFEHKEEFSWPLEKGQEGRDSRKT